MNDHVLAQLADTIEARRQSGDPATSYVAKLKAKGLDAMLKKVGEEATEFVLAAKDRNAMQVTYEAADLWFHSLMALAEVGVRPEQVLGELARREGLSGLAEFASRPADPKI
ncbi:phosphoribosyl-ATP diphosphatase [Inhella gelatinilytica]|uniref:Phosphoribosyl-ATP pyrophosphatase n=1 Tax=Inhella gelatinilytica TaxID=2795030 RepID=A0A931IUZ6_9BURK|nr:phosphoribosyl-ATP diphosphatase [Inhella gelatinilytica]MBH9553267.1 phosphoribosyl-ATP diphosphatase [Inhella gelatinilytica]